MGQCVAGKTLHTGLDFKDASKALGAREVQLDAKGVGGHGVQQEGSVSMPFG